MNRQDVWELPETTDGLKSWYLVLEKWPENEDGSIDLYFCSRRKGSKNPLHEMYTIQANHIDSLIYMVIEANGTSAILSEIMAWFQT